MVIWVNLKQNRKKALNNSILLTEIKNLEAPWIILPTTPSVSVISQIPKIINDYRSEFL
jgi:hypothetical protein